MAIIPAFPVASPELNDLLLGTKIKEGGNTTKNFTIGEVLALIGDPYPIPTSVNYGLFSQTSNSQEIKNTTAVRSLVGPGVGSKIIPANTFAVGDSFSINTSGYINCLNAATLTVTVATAGGFSLATCPSITMKAATNKTWSLNVNFTIRSIGEAGAASIATGGTFTYNKDADNIPESVNFLTIEDEEFDTTILNDIGVIVQWATASLSNNIYSNIYNFTKTY
jgi:hypothetical protein